MIAILDLRKYRIWQLLEEAGVGMVTTRFAGGLRARPLDGRPDRDASAIFFVTDLRGLKDDEIEACPDVCFTVTDTGDKAYLSITGRAQILHDPDLAAKYWKKADDVWWPDWPSGIVMCGCCGLIRTSRSYGMDLPVRRWRSMNSPRRGRRAKNPIWANRKVKVKF